MKMSKLSFQETQIDQCGRFVLETWEIYTGISRDQQIIDHRANRLFVLNVIMSHTTHWRGDKRWRGLVRDVRVIGECAKIYQ